MDERLQQLIDEHEIRKTLSQYCNSCDRLDEVRMTDVYAEDSWDDHGLVKAPGPEYAHIMAAHLQQTSLSLWHLLGQTIVNVIGDEAGAETYFFVVSRSMSDDGVEMCNQLGGRFVDRLVRVGTRWKIKRREVVGDWTLSLPLQAWENAQSLTPGVRSEEDPSFAVLGLGHSGIPAPLT